MLLRALTVIRLEGALCCHVKSFSKSFYSRLGLAGPQLVEGVTVGEIVDKGQTRGRLDRLTTLDCG